MSLTFDRKRQKDRNRVKKMLRKDHNLRHRALRLIFKSVPMTHTKDTHVTTKQTAAQMRLRKFYKESYADVSVLSMLVGEGYLRIEGDSYLLTRKGHSEYVIDIPPTPKDGDFTVRAYVDAQGTEEHANKG